MKRTERKHGARRAFLWTTSIALACTVAFCGFSAGAIFAGGAPAIAETSAPAATAEPAGDPSPAIYVSQKNANSVVGVMTNKEEWDRSTNEVKETLYSQGSGVVIAEGGYVLTNFHVIENGDSYEVLMPSGEKADAQLAGADASLDLAVLQVEDDYADDLTPVSIGSSSDLVVGSTVIAIGNPGGEVLANTVTQGVVSALERSSVEGNNTTRNVDYIQHDAAINSGNSGGALFNYKGELVGINTLKYAGSVYSTVNFEGLGFAIPIDTAYPIAQQLIENGEVVRPQLGVTVKDFAGPDEPTGNYPPASVCIYGVNENSPAEKAGLKQYDFIYAINGERVSSFRELSTVLDKYAAGDTIEVTVVRYKNAYMVSNNSNNNYYNSIWPFFGGYGYGYGAPNYGNSNASDQGSIVDGQLVVEGGYEFVDVELTLELPEENNG